MITRMRISGFKNLVDLDVRFGPLACVAGPNGVGKSNLFDAIVFLSALADKTLVEAAMSVRGEGGRAADIRHLFHCAGDHHADKMSFEVEMIIPRQGMDDYGQTAHASITSLRHAITLAHRSSSDAGPLELVQESLEPIKLKDAPKHFLFPLKAKTWRKSAVLGKRSRALMSTEGDRATRTIKMHQDGQRLDAWGGRGRRFAAATLPRTVLSSATNAVECPTALLVRREMQSWRMLLLEASSLRKPDETTAPKKLNSRGAHLPATLHRLAGHGGSADAEGQTYAALAAQLAELIDDVQGVRVDRDEKRELLTLEVVDREGTAHPARSLSDGTLRFLALSILSMDSKETGLLCLEEPENGIHPERLPAMIRLLCDIATNTQEQLGDDNSLNQVIVNTHSPAVAGQMPDDCLLVAELRQCLDKNGKRCKSLSLSCLDETWRAKKAGMATVSKGKLLSYLNPILLHDEDAKKHGGARRVVDRPDLQQLLLFPLVSSFSQSKVLHDLLWEASGRRRKANTHMLASQVAKSIGTFAPLRQLTAFNKLEEDFKTSARKRGWLP